MNRKPAILFFVLFVFLLSCNHHKTEKKRQITITKEDVTTINKHLVEEDETLIIKYAERRGWELKKTAAGLWYMIYKEGNGNKVGSGSEVTVDYTIELLDGTVCYDSERDGDKTFIVGQAEIASGLQKGLELLREGDCAKIILPPHLGHGLLGDTERIPARSTIVFDICIKKVK